MTYQVGDIFVESNCHLKGPIAHGGNHWHPTSFVKLASLLLQTAQSFCHSYASRRHEFCAKRLLRLIQRSEVLLRPLTAIRGSDDRR